MSESLFSNVDTSRPLLGILDMGHSSQKIKAYLDRPEFLAEAVRYGYSAILVEQNTEEAALNKALSHDDPDKLFPDSSSFPEIQIIPVDPRSNEQKAAMRKTFGIMTELLDKNAKDSSISDDERFLNDQVIVRVSREERKQTRANFDPQLLQNIREARSQHKKVILLYGPNHFERGSVLDQGIPGHERTLVLLYENEDAMDRIPYNPASDARPFFIERTPPPDLKIQASSLTNRENPTTPTKKIPHETTLSWDDLGLP